MKVTLANFIFRNRYTTFTTDKLVVSDLDFAFLSDQNAYSDWGLTRKANVVYLTQEAATKYNELVEIYNSGFDTGYAVGCDQGMYYSGDYSDDS